MKTERKTTKPRQPVEQTVEPAASEPVTARPATIAELRALPGVDADFVLQMLEAGATIQTAIDAWIAEQNRRLEKLQSKLAEVSSGKR